jgi:hypothetical protein
VRLTVIHESSFNDDSSLFNRYFDFHPVPEVGAVSSKTHGLIPVWGFGTVIVSAHPKIHEGERVYGYFAPTRYLLVPVSSDDVNKYAFYVPRPHLPAGMFADLFPLASFQVLILNLNVR